MSLKCNIDERGARARRAWGFAALLAAALLSGLAFWAALWWVWLAVGFCAAAGALALFEAHMKWCILRALGLKTPL